MKKKDTWFSSELIMQALQQVKVLPKPTAPVTPKDVRIKTK
jgi:hypothetical protein